MNLRIIALLSAALGGGVPTAGAAPFLYSVAPNGNGIPAIYRIDVGASTVTPLLQLGDGSLGFNGGLVFTNAAFYAIANDFLDNSSLVTVAPGTGVITQLNQPLQGIHGGLTLSTANSHFYAIASDLLGNGSLYDIPTSCCSANLQLPLGGTGFTGGLAYRQSNGLFYAIANDSAGHSTLYSTNLSQVNSVPVTLGDGFYGGLAIDPATDLLYAISSDSFGMSTLVSIDTTAPSVQPLFSLGPGFVNASLTVGPDVSADVPEPAAWLLTGLGFAVILWRRR